MILCVQFLPRPPGSVAPRASLPPGDQYPSPSSPRDWSSRPWLPALGSCHWTPAPSHSPALMRVHTNIYIYTHSHTRTAHDTQRTSISSWPLFLIIIVSQLLEYCINLPWFVDLIYGGPHYSITEGDKACLIYGWPHYSITEGDKACLIYGGPHFHYWGRQSLSYLWRATLFYWGRQSLSLDLNWGPLCIVCSPFWLSLICTLY